MHTSLMAMLIWRVLGDACLPWVVMRVRELHSVDGMTLRGG